MTDPRGTRRWRNLRAVILGRSDMCWLCGQAGADSIDHIIEVAVGGDMWDPTNLAPAHLRKRPGCPGNTGRSANVTRRELKPNASRPW